MPEERHDIEERAMTDDDKMLQDHQATWSGFVKLMAVSVVVITLILILMGIFLV